MPIIRRLCSHFDWYVQLFRSGIALLNRTV